MAVKLSAAEAAAMAGDYCQVLSNPVGDTDFDFENIMDDEGNFLHFGQWNKHEKRYTRYLRKRR